jgi:hypothetical protein
MKDTASEIREQLIAGIPLSLVVTVSLVVLCTLLALAGELLCLGVPAESGARGFLWVALLFQLLGAAPAVAALFTDLPEGVEENAQFGVLLGFLFFLLFLRQLADFLGDPGLAKMPLTMLIVLVVTGVLAGVAVVVARVFPDVELPDMPYLQKPLPLFVPVVVLGAVVFYFLYARLLVGLREAASDRVWELTS